MIYPTTKVLRHIATAPGYLTTMDGDGNAKETKRVKKGDIVLDECVLADTADESKAEQVKVKAAKDKAKADKKGAK